MSKIKILFLIFFIVNISLFISSCGKKTNTGGEQKKEDVKTDEQKKDNSSSGKSNDLGIVEGLPKDYPSDIPQPKNSKCMGSLTTSEGTVVTFESDDRPKDILDLYNGELAKAGYKKDEGEMMSEDGGMAMWKKDKKECSLMLAWDKDKKKSSVVVTYK